MSRNIIFSIVGIIIIVFILVCIGAATPAAQAPASSPDLPTKIETVPYYPCLNAKGVEIQCKG